MKSPGWSPSPRSCHGEPFPLKSPSPARLFLRGNSAFRRSAHRPAGAGAAGAAIGRRRRPEPVARGEAVDVARQNGAGGGEMANLRFQRGLTLIELLIAVTLAVFILAALNSVTTLGLNAQASGRQANELVYQARFALDRMAAKARSTAPKLLTTPSSAGTTGDGDAHDERAAGRRCAVSAALRPVRAAGFTLLPVILAMSLIAAIAFLLNRDNGVNARMIANRSDLDRARYAAEAGLQVANFVVQGAGCTGNYPTSSGPLTNNNFGGATYSAYSSRASLPGGNPPPPISLTSTGSYNGASVTLTRNNVYVYKPQTTTILQPGPTSGYDTSVNPGFPDRHYGGTSTLRLYTGNFQPLLKFDLSIFPSGSRVIPWYDTGTGKLQPGATLSLYTSQSGYFSPALVNAQLITRSWVAGTRTGLAGYIADGATWNTYDGVNAWPSPGVGYAPAPVASTPNPNVIGWVTWDLTNAVAAWLSGVSPNYGIWLVESGASVGDTIYVSSNETSQTTRRPMLTLNTLLPCGTSVGGGGGPSQTVTLAAVADTYITADTNNGNYIRNYGLDTTMYVGEVGTSPSLENRMLLKFDLSGIPTGKIVNSATLRLYLNQVVSGT